MKNRKNIIIISIIVIVIITLLIFQINRFKGTNNRSKNSVKETIASNVEVDYKSGNEVTINAKDKEKQIEFEIEGNITENVVYDINIKTNSNIKSENIKFSLKKKVNDSEFIEIVEEKSFDILKKYYRIYIDVLPKESNIKHTYRLYYNVINYNDDIKLNIKVNGNVVSEYKAIG